MKDESKSDVCCFEDRDMLTHFGLPYEQESTGSLPAEEAQRI